LKSHQPSPEGKRRVFLTLAREKESALSLPREARRYGLAKKKKGEVGKKPSSIHQYPKRGLMSTLSGKVRPIKVKGSLHGGGADLEGTGVDQERGMGKRGQEGRGELGGGEQR